MLGWLRAPRGSVHEERCDDVREAMVSEKSNGAPALLSLFGRNITKDMKVALCSVTHVTKRCDG